MNSLSFEPSKGRELIRETTHPGFQNKRPNFNAEGEEDQITDFPFSLQTVHEMKQKGLWQP